jgi:hypothetical protein
MEEAQALSEALVERAGLSGFARPWQPAPAGPSS